MGREYQTFQEWVRYHNSGQEQADLITIARAKIEAKIRAKNKPKTSRQLTRSSWINMKSRCYRQKDRQFANYGGRGITVCDKWIDDFDAFLADMGERPHGMSIDRIDNEKGYFPGNCRWATTKEQVRNTRRNKVIVYKGQTKCLASWADDLGISYRALICRMQRGQAFEQAISLVWRRIDNISHGNETKSISEWSRELGINYNQLWRRIRVRGWTLQECMAWWYCLNCKYDGT